MKGDYVLNVHQFHQNRSHLQLYHHICLPILIHLNLLDQLYHYSFLSIHGISLPQFLSVKEIELAKKGCLECDLLVRFKIKG